MECRCKRIWSRATYCKYHWKLCDKFCRKMTMFVPYKSVVEYMDAVDAFVNVLLIEQGGLSIARIHSTEQSSHEGFARVRMFIPEGHTPTIRAIETYLSLQL